MIAPCLDYEPVTDTTEVISIDIARQRQAARLAYANLVHALEVIDAGTGDALTWESPEPNADELARGKQLVEFKFLDVDFAILFAAHTPPEAFVANFAHCLRVTRDSIDKAIAGIEAACPEAVQGPAKSKGKAKRK